MEELDKRTANQLRRIARKKVQKDVESSRWKRFLKAENEQYWRVGGRLFWETLKSVKHGSDSKLDRHGELRSPRLFWMYQDKEAIELDGGRLFLWIHGGTILSRSISFGKIFASSPNVGNQGTMTGCA
ncbi:hypothetical protein EI77_03562 [Prosthecobacter fusiformis]|uniref:Uncharacterized protein n=1 Tax=Prosthecobacter fusiformis TaxID=48464 RepID=A0A4R7RQB4_9BACT|nr:hypothetical protein EI77_03562 [Prosthecobacter fusiformis]